MEKVNNSSFNRDERGFSLIEVVLAVAILGLVGVSLLLLVVNSYAYSVSTGNKSQAAALSQDKMEAFQAMPYDELLEKAGSLNNTFSCPGGKAQAHFEPVTGFEHISRSFQIECINLQVEGHPVNILKITVEAHYDKPGKNSVTLTSYVKEK